LKLKKRNKDSQGLQCETALDFSKSFKNFTAYPKQTSSASIINKKDMKEVASLDSTQPLKLKLKNKKRTLVSNQVNFYPASGVSKESAEEADRKMYVLNQPMREVKSSNVIDQGLKSITSENQYSVDSGLGRNFYRLDQEGKLVTDYCIFCSQRTCLLET